MWFPKKKDSVTFNEERAKRILALRGYYNKETELINRKKLLADLRVSCGQRFNATVLSKWFNGTRPIGRATAEQLATALDVRVGQLTGELPFTEDASASELPHSFQADGETINERRTELDMTTSQMAELAGVSLSTAERAEQSNDLEREILRRISDALGLILPAVIKTEPTPQESRKQVYPKEIRQITLILAGDEETSLSSIRYRIVPKIADIFLRSGLVQQYIMTQGQMVRSLYIFLETSYADAERIQRAFDARHLAFLGITDVQIRRPRRLWTPFWWLTLLSFTLLGISVICTLSWSILPALLLAVAGSLSGLGGWWFAKTGDDRKTSTLAAIANSVLLLLWCLLALLQVFGRSNDDDERRSPPSNRNASTAANTGTDRQKPPVATHRDSPPIFNGQADRKAAEYVLSVGGTIKVKERAEDIINAADLPREPFHLTYVNLLNKKRVTDAGLVNFKGCNDLLHLELDNNPFTDKGLTNFKGITSLTFLGLGQSSATDAGLENFRDCRKLTYIGLFGLEGVGDSGLLLFKDCDDLHELQLGKTRIGDATLTQFEHCKKLTTIDVGDTNVTPKGIADFKKALPKCKIIATDTKP